MGINKIIPRGLSSDTDERLVKPGFMPDATNVTLSEGGLGTESVLKNCKGTIPGEPLNSNHRLPNDINKSYVIGEVSDSQRGFIYFFVSVKKQADNGEVIRTSMIYQYDVEIDRYKRVLSDDRLNFRDNYYITANVLNGAFQQDGVVQTILYFTDNVNPPRKINVDRAFAGDYSGLSDDQFDYSVNTIKAAPEKAPTTNFNTTEELPHNNFKTTAFQFATQIIYVDGEESAISPYSKLTFPESLAFHGIEEASNDDSVYTQLRLEVDNTCEVSMNIDPQILTCKDVSKIRLIAREGNTSAFYIIDEFDPNENLVRQVYGQDIDVYNSGGGVYRFFNDILGTTVPTPTEDKLFDNVPLKARGQAVVGNRLMYSNYEEGRPNHDVKSNISVTYKDDTAQRKEFVNQGEGLAFSSFVDDNLGFTFKPLEQLIDEVDSETVFDAGTQVNISFNMRLQDLQVFNPNNDRPIFNVDVEAVSSYENFNGTVLQPTGTYTYAIDEFLPSTSDPDGLGETEPVNVTVTYTTPSDFTLQQFLEFIPAQISNSTFSHDYTGKFTLTPTQAAREDFEPIFGAMPDLFMSPFTPGTPAYEANSDAHPNNINVSFKLSATLNENNTISVSVEAFEAKLNNTDNGLDDPYSIAYDQTALQNKFWRYQNAGSLVEPVDIASVSGTSLVNEFQSEVPYDYSIVDVTPLQGFKSGALHPLGIIYKDKFGRSSFVNKLGSAYVGWYNDHDRLKEGVSKIPGNDIFKEETFDGPASISVKFLNNPPDWADAFQIVYPGNSLTDNFIQYSAVGAYAARKGDFTNGTTGEFRKIDTESKRIYVSFETLDIYRDQKNTVRDYSFTAGDKLRIKSAAFQPDSTVSEVSDAYFSANDGGVIEFDVVGVELLTNDVTNPIAFNVSDPTADIGSLNNMDVRFIGKFLVLEAPQIAGGATSINGDQIKYPGWDWYHISYDSTTNPSTVTGGIQTAYPDGTVVGDSPLNYWQRQPIVEIYTPKKSTSNQFYYEIGEAVTIDRSVELPSFDENGLIRNPDTAVDYLSFHGPELVLDTGDVHYRPVACKTADWRDEDDDGATDGTFQFRWFVKDDWVYKTKLLEDFSPSDRIEEKMWSKGRAHVEFKNAATIRRFNGLTYSDAYAEDVANLSLSSFNATLANFGSLESKYGAINYIYNYGTTGELLALQENKLSKTNVNSRILFDAAGGQNVALSTDVIGSTRYFVGDFGCGDHPEAVLVYDNDIFFVDVSRKKVLRVSGDQMVPISDKSMSSTFNDIFRDWGSSSNSSIGDSKARKIVSGYDPDEETYYVTFYHDRPLLSFGNDSEIDFSDVYSDIEFNGYTLSYDVPRGHWQAKHSFIPTIYSNQNNTMYSCKYVFDAESVDPRSGIPLLFHRHDDLLDDNGDPINRTKFYNQNTAQSDFTVISNASSSAVKVYDALSYEGTNQPDRVSIESSNGSSNDSIGLITSEDYGQYAFVEKEDSFYIALPRDTSGNSSSHVSGLGECASVDTAENSITINASLIGIPIPVGAQLVIASTGIDISGQTSLVTTVNAVDGNKIFVSISPSENIVGEDIVLVHNPFFDGDSIRGHYATIKSNFKEETVYEVYCVNAHVTNSPLHHTSTN